jgi:hypothetical protein
MDPSRQTPQQTSSDPIPIPEADARSRKARTVRIQDILAAHARALDVRLEEGMREMRLAMEAAIRRSDIHQVPEAASAPPPQAPPAPAAPATPPPPAPSISVSPDVAKGLAQQTDERFQALSMRLQNIEDAIRSASLSGGDAVELAAKLDAATEGMNRVADAEEDLFDRVLETQRHGLEELTHRIGLGVAAVIRAMQTELTATITRLELTADASMAVAPDEAARLERTMMAIAERQEAVLDGRLAELRESLGGVAPPEEDSETVNEPPAEAIVEEYETPKAEAGTLDEEAIAAKREAEREAALTTFEDEAWPWPEPDGEAEGQKPIPTDEAVTSAPDEPAAMGDPIIEAEEPADSTTEEVAGSEPEVGEATTDAEVAANQVSLEESPAPKKKRRRRRKKKPATEPDAVAETENGEDAEAES